MEETPLKIESVKYTDIGNRSVNEDYLLAKQAEGRCFFALGDGLGGHGMGDAASKLACELALATLTGIPRFTNDMFGGVYAACQEALLAEQARRNARRQMRTTLNLLCLDESHAYWSHIGDSRTYYFRDKALVRRTFDHSVPQMLAAAGKLPESEIRFHEDRNRLLKVLGVEEMKPAFEQEEPVPLRGNQQFLLCSDGFWELISEEQMLLCLDEAENPAVWMDNMAELIRRNAAGREADNRTAIAVWIYDS